MKDTLLIVDNDESILRCLTLMLKHEFNILTASSGKEALEIAKSNKIECVVSDYDMENGNGLFLLKNLVKKEVPFILVTGHGEKDLFKAFANERAFYIYEKPVRTNIVEIIRDALSSYHAAQRQLRESLIGKNTGHILHDVQNGLAIIESTATQGMAKACPDASNLFSISLKACKKIEVIVSKYKSFMDTSGVVQLAQVKLGAFLSELVSELEESFGDEVDFELMMSSQDLAVVADSDLLRQVLLNLISNSVHAIKNDPEPKIKITTSREQNITTIEVLDSGSISEELVPLLFKEGFSTKGESGTGMGLNYCKELLEKMNATISLTGLSPTKFSITFKTQ